MFCALLDSRQLQGKVGSGERALGAATILLEEVGPGPSPKGSEVQRDRRHWRSLLGEGLACGDLWTCIRVFIREMEYKYIYADRRRNFKELGGTVEGPGESEIFRGDQQAGDPGRVDAAA